MAATRRVGPAQSPEGAKRSSRASDLTAADRCGPSFHAVMARLVLTLRCHDGEKKLPISMDPEIRCAEALRPVVGALRSLLASARPEAKPFLRDWPRELIARPQGARTLPVVSALEGLSQYAAPETQALVEAVAALTRDLDWRQTYSSADFGERFLQNYGWSEWIGQRGMFESDAIACGVLLLGRDTEYPAHSHEAEELYLPLAGHAFWARRQLRLAAAPAGTIDPSSRLDEPRHAHRSGASARGLCLARGQPHREIAGHLGSNRSGHRSMALPALVLEHGRPICGGLKRDNAPLPDPTLRIMSTTSRPLDPKRTGWRSASGCR